MVYLTLGITNWNNRIYLLIRSHLEGQAVGIFRIAPFKNIVSVVLKRAEISPR